MGYTKEGFGLFEVFEEFRVFETPIQLPTTWKILYKGLKHIYMKFGVFDGFEEFQMFRTPINLIIFWPFLKNASFLYLKRVWIV